MIHFLTKNLRDRYYFLEFNNCEPKINLYSASYPATEGHERNIHFSIDRFAIKFNKLNGKFKQRVFLNYK